MSPLQRHTLTTSLRAPVRGRKASQRQPLPIHPLGLGATPPPARHASTHPPPHPPFPPANFTPPPPFSPPPPPSTSHCIITRCIADLTPQPSSSPPATSLRLRLRAAVAFSEPHDKGARTSTDTALCVLDPPGTRHTKHSHQRTPGPDPAPFGTSRHCVFFCKQATASPEALTRSALPDCSIRPRHHQLCKHNPSNHTS